MRVIVTGARAPACLEWSRVLSLAGCSVAVADSVAFPLSRFSSCSDRFFILPEPARDVNAFGSALQAAARSFNADLILPTCEEAFYISHQKRRLEQECRALVSDFALMARLHNKWEFARFTANLPVAAPHTQYLESTESLQRLAGCADTLVIKPVFSRFASKCLIRPCAKDVLNLRPTVEQPWVAQEYVAGRELCSYSILQDGRLLAHVCYNPRYRVGKGAGVCFQPEDVDEIRDFVKAFGELTRYTGQVGFDFVDTKERGLFVLECNPRATSGIHLLAKQPEALAQTLQPPQSAPLLNGAQRPRMVKLAAALFVLPRLRSRAEIGDFVKTWREAEDIIASPRDRWPILAQWLGLGEMALRALLRRRSFLEVTTYDIEWNGQALGDQP